MDRVEHISVEEAARLDGRKYRAELRWLERKRIVLMPDPEDARRKLVPVSALSSTAYQLWMKEQTSAALQNVNGESDSASVPANGPQALLPFALPSQKERGLRNAAPAAIPAKHQTFIGRWSEVLGNHENGGWKRHVGFSEGGILIRHRGDYIRVPQKLYGRGFAPSTIRAKIKLLREINSDPAIAPEDKMSELWKRILPNNRAGRSHHTFFCQPENLWMGPKLESFYLTQARRDVPAARRLLLREIDAKERAWQGQKKWERPTLHQCRTYLKNIDFPTVVLAREGDEAYRNKCAPYIKRRPPEHSADFVVTDQKLLDILVRDSGWRLGRIWTVNYVDVASWRRLGGAYGPAVSGDMNMEAAAWMLGEACVPGHVQMDLGKEFVGQRFNGGIFRISGERLYAEAVGLWHRLGIKPVEAIGRNPQTKPIERIHRCLRSLEQSFITYTGPNPQERPPRLALLEKQAREFKEGRAPAPPIPTVEQVIAASEWWWANRWNSGHRGKGRYLQGMTPDEAWNVKRPAEGFRTLTESEVEYYTADRHFLKIARGGQVNLSIYGQTIEYVAPELFLHQGEEAEVLVSRRALDQVTVIYPVAGGTESCVARLKQEVPWGSESRAEVKLRLRCIHAIKRTLKRSLRAIGAAEDVLAEAPFLPTDALLDQTVSRQIINPRQFFGTSTGTPPPLGHPEICSTQYVGERMRLRKESPRQETSEEVAEAAWRSYQEGK